MKTIAIKGKNYVQVNERVKAFRSTPEFKGWVLQTDIITLTDEICVMQTFIRNEEGRVIATGTAREVRNDATSMVNKTSYVENCETSAVGRALGFLGIGIDENICSADEFSYALQAQEQPQPQKTAPAAPVTSKGGAIYPAKEEAPKTQEKPDDDEFLELMADIESVETSADLIALMHSDRVQGSPYVAAILHAGHNFAKKKGWE